MARQTTLMNVDKYMGGFTNPSQVQTPVPVVLSRHIDCSVTNLTSGDNYDILDIPTGFEVIGVVVNTRTAEGGAATLDVGYYLLTSASTAATKFEGDADLNSVLTTASIPPDASYEFLEDARIIITPDADLDTAKFDVHVICLDRNTLIKEEIIDFDAND